MRLALIYARMAVAGAFRVPAFWVSTMIFPALMYTFFGLPFAENGRIANILMASWSTFAAVGIGLFQFGIRIAQDRESPWENFARTLPTGPAPKFISQVLVALLFVGCAAGLVWIIAALATPIEMNLWRWLRLTLAMVVGVVPFTLLGILIGYSFSPRAAVPVANLVYLPLAYLGGLWMPPSSLPEAVATISRFTPTRHFGELTWAAALGQPFPAESLIWLTGYAVLFAALAFRAWRRDELTRYG